MKNLAQALNDLSTGSSYAAVSMEMRQRREAARKHLESHRREAWRGPGVLLAAEPVPHPTPGQAARCDVKTRLTDAQHEMFEHLTSRTFYVVDTEYTSGPGKDGNHLISIAVVPVVAGRRNTKDDFYKEMNPGVPIDPRATAKNRFTDATVAGKRKFRSYAEQIIKALADPDAVFVAHTNCDILVLRAELTRLDEARTPPEVRAWPALASLPELPIIDTSTLARLVAYEGVGHRGSMSLARLCELTSARNRKPHHALSDARATADALLELLAHVATKASFYDLSELLRAHDRGTTASPRGPAYIRSRREFDPELPPSHVARHADPLDHTGTREDLLAWTDLAAECVQLRCQWLRDEVRAAAPDNGPGLLDRLVKLLPVATQPGQSGTLLGAIHELIAPRDAGVEPAFAATRALRWWAVVRPQVAASQPCGDGNEQACPSCRAAQPCPRDILYQAIVEMAVLGTAKELTRKRIDDYLLGNDKSRKINRWPRRHPEAVAWMLWRVVAFEQDLGLALAMNHLEVAKDRGLHLIEPRLALMVCQQLLDTVDLDEAATVAEAVLANRTTDTAFDDLALWLVWTKHSAAAAARTAKPRNIRFPRRARPEGRVSPNPYAPIRPARSGRGDDAPH
jgi:DNA polymerase III epsilon subunit-like protein